MEPEPADDIYFWRTQSKIFSNTDSTHLEPWFPKANSLWIWLHVMLVKPKILEIFASNFLIDHCF